SREPVRPAHARSGDAELAAGERRRDVRVRARVDLGIDAQRDRRYPIPAGCDGGELLQLLFALAVELEDARFPRRLHLVPPLADTGKDDLRRVASRVQGAEELSARHDVEAETVARKQQEQRQL